jgi:hypothetical protein
MIAALSRVPKPTHPSPVVGEGDLAVDGGGGAWAVISTPFF